MNPSDTSVPLLGPADDSTVHVMTFNLRYPADDPGHEWEVRRPATAALLCREQPTVLGTQEGHHRQILDIAADLPGHYAWLGLGREGGARGEFAAVFYDSRRLRVLDFDHLWLSDSPRLIGSTGWGATLPRMATWVRFGDRAGGEFVVLNTHLDHASAQARTRAAELLATTLGEFTGPIVVTGDFNAEPGSDPHTVMLRTAGLRDVWDSAAEHLSPAYGSFTGYEEPAVGGQRIDWILVTPEVKVEAAAVNPFTLGGTYASDHLPVQARLRLPR